MTSKVDKLLIPKQLKLTTKYTEEDRERVRTMYHNGHTQRAIARDIPMSRRMVSFILFPERMQRCKEQFATRQKTGIYRYPTKVQSAMVKAVRARKKKMINSLIPNK